MSKDDDEEEEYNEAKKQIQQKLEEVTTTEYKLRRFMVGKSLGLFSTDNKFRIAIFKLAVNEWYERLIFFFVILSSV